jgi:hypothetical protein
LTEWADVDVAQYHLGFVLGVLPSTLEGESGEEHFSRCKSIFWTANGLGDMLYNGLLALVEVGVLERYVDDEEGMSPVSPFRFTQNVPTELTGLEHTV